MGVESLLMAGLVGVASLTGAPNSSAPQATSATGIKGWSTRALDLDEGDRFAQTVSVTPHGKYRKFRVVWRERGQSWNTVQKGRTSGSRLIRVRYTPPGPGAYQVKVKVLRKGPWGGLVTEPRRVHVTVAPEPGPTPTPTPTTTPAPTPTTTPVQGATVFAVGDIGQCGGAAADSAALIPTHATVLALGDLAYPDGTARDFADCYLPAYGSLLDTTYPVPGNHEYHDNAIGYFSVFGSRVGTPSEPWYAMTRGPWTFYQLNSNCSDVGGCDPTSPQYRWLSGQLATDPNLCVAASWHHPRWSASLHGPAPEMSDMYALLVSHGADLLLTGHEHDYQRFARLDASGAVSASGLREFVVGTGGASLYPIGIGTPMPQVANASTHGVLRLDMTADGYTWRFLATDGSSVDEGADSCG